MSDDGTMSTGAGGETGESGPKLHDASGEQRRPDRRSTPGQVDTLAEFMKEQPLSVALAALVIGYLLGKVT